MKSSIKIASMVYVPEHVSFLAAVDAGKRFANSVQDKTDFVQGKAIVDYSYDGGVVLFSLSEGCWMKITAELQGVRVEVGREACAGFENAEEKECKIIFPSGNELVWKWDFILKNICGAKIRIAPSDSVVFMHAKDRSSLMFCSLVSEGGQPILFFDEV